MGSGSFQFHRETPVKFRYIYCNFQSVKYTRFQYILKFSQVTLCEIPKSCLSSLSIITPELTTQSCWLFKIFQVSILYLLTKKSWRAFICSSVKKSVFISEKKKNDPQLFLCNSPTRTLPLLQELQNKLISFLPLYQKEEALTLQSLSISFTRWYHLIFHLPEAVGIVFWIITSYSININMINPKSFLFFVLFLSLHQSLDQ